MSRMIRHDATRPALISIGDKVVAVCQCGLSQNKPFCDGSHRVTRDEEPNKLYAYDREKKRVALDDLFPDPGAEKHSPPGGN